MAAIESPESEAPPGSQSPAYPESAASRSAARLSAAGVGVALPIIATVAMVFALKWAQSFVVSLLLGIIFSYALNPLVAFLERMRIPRMVGSTIVMAGVVCSLVLGAYSLRGEVQTIVDQLPEATSKLSAALASLREGEPSTMQKVQTAASEFEKAASQAAGAASTPKQPGTRVVMDAPGFKLSNFLWAGSLGAAGLLAQAAMVVSLTFFLLLSGDTYKRKLVRLAGPSLSKRKITVQVLDDINKSIQRYMVMLVATNVLVGLLTWIALRWIGLENAGVWAVTAGLLHLIPYFGSPVTATVIGVATFMQFGTVSTALLVAVVSLTIAGGVGTLVTTWIAGRIAKVNTAAVFVSLLFWTWLWGVWGMLLSVPIIAIVKVVAQHIEQLEPVAELLAD
jgi:predicted PurR-regulated permease PerM